MSVKSFRDLRVWQAAMRLARDIHAATRSFPRSEMYGLVSQINRAAVSVLSNIAEGHAREHTREYLYHLSVAQASLAELETQLDLACQFSYLSEEQWRTLQEAVDAVGRQLQALRKAVRGSSGQPPVPSPQPLQS